MLRLGYVEVVAAPSDCMDTIRDLLNSLHSKFIKGKSREYKEIKFFQDLKQAIGIH